MTIVITKDNAPAYAMRRYLKAEPVPALYIPEPFVVDMEGDGWGYCEDGYLVLDMDGQPYAVPRAKFEAMYKLVEPGQ